MSLGDEEEVVVEVECGDVAEEAEVGNEYWYNVNVREP
jgi:hypothetical protein